MNKNQWIFNINYSEYNFHLIYTHAYKSEAIKIIIKIINFIETKYNNKWCLLNPTKSDF